MFILSVCPFEFSSPSFKWATLDKKNITSLVNLVTHQTPCSVVVCFVLDGRMYGRTQCVKIMTTYWPSGLGGSKMLKCIYLRRDQQVYVYDLAWAGWEVKPWKKKTYLLCRKRAIYKVTLRSSMIHTDNHTVLPISKHYFYLKKHLFVRFLKNERTEMYGYNDPYFGSATWVRRILLVRKRKWKNLHKCMRTRMERHCEML